MVVREAIVSVIDWLVGALVGFVHWWAGARECCGCADASGV